MPIRSNVKLSSTMQALPQKEKGSDQTKKRQMAESHVFMDRRLQCFPIMQRLLRCDVHRHAANDQVIQQDLSRPHWQNAARHNSGGRF